MKKEEMSKDAMKKPDKWAWKGRNEERRHEEGRHEER
jgi:hypothetical protein